MRTRGPATRRCSLPCIRSLFAGFESSISELGVSLFALFALGAARQILDPGTRRTTRWGRAPRRRGRLRSSGRRERRLPDARWDRLLRSASLARARGAAGLAQVDAEPDAWNSSIIIAVIRKPTISQEILDFLMVVTIRDCGKLKVEDVRVPQPILHHIVPHRFSCADEPINLCNGNISHTEDAGRLGVD